MPELPEPKERVHPYRLHAKERGTVVPPLNESFSSCTSSARCLSSSASCLSPVYTELHVTTNFTFLTGASHPEEYIIRAAELGHTHAAITDRNSLAGIVRAHVAAKDAGIRLAVGCCLELIIDQTRGTVVPPLNELSSSARCLSVLVYPTDVHSYGRLCQLLTLGKRRAPKGECHLALHDLIDHHDGLLAVVIPPSVLDHDFIEVVEGLHRVFGADDRLSIAASCLYTSDDRYRLQRIEALAQHVGVPMVATNDVHYHVPERRALQDVLICIKHGCAIGEAGHLLFQNAERHLKPADEMARLFADYPQAIARTITIAERASQFNLDELRYQYPDEICPAGMSAMEYLTTITWQGAAERYPNGVPENIVSQIRHELVLIDELKYAPYFLTVYDFVKHARSQGILCQGRGAAANSAVCYCIGVTSVDPAKIDLLFERFVSHERNEPPDIDIDFEHERREEVIQYIYAKYSRERAALTAEVITYRGRSAIREVGKALGLSLDAVDLLAKSLDWWDHGIVNEDRVRELGMNPNDPTIQQLAALANEIRGFPRHLSQHVGGFVITQRPLCELVPIENAAMPDRTVIEWDKDDIDAMGMLKVDVLGLGMLTCIRKALRFVNRRHEAEEERHRAEEEDTSFSGGTIVPRVEEEARRHETEARRRSAAASRYQSGHNQQLPSRLSENANGGNNQDVSRSYCMVERNGPNDAYLSDQQRHANLRAIRPDQSDAKVGCLDSIQYRRGIREAEHYRLSQASSLRQRIAGRAGNSVRTCTTTQYDSFDSRNKRTDSGRGSNPSGPDPQPPTRGTVAPPLNRGSSSARCLSSSAPCLHLANIPPDDASVYDMICNADTVGVFQIESRAQMTMLPRLRPRCYYDLVIEVAIVRPGPIQGDMVHPYLRRRNGEEPVEYPSDDVKRVLGKTLGVPLFQEQAMSLAMVAAGFTAGEADQLRRAMAAWKRKGDQLHRFGEKLIAGMIERGYEREFAERCFNQIKGFSEYGFPESHAASFAHLVYVSAWLKHHYPAAFAAALINSLPMGFYAPAQIVRDAQEHGVEVREVDVNFSTWDCGLEEENRHEAEGEERHRGIKASRHRAEEEDSTSFSGGTIVPRSGHASRSHEVAQSQNDGGGDDKNEHDDHWHPALRLGMRLIKGLREEHAHAIANAVRAHGPFDTIEALWKSSGVPVYSLKKLAQGDTFRSMGLDRQQALWHIRELRDDDLEMPLFEENSNSHSSSTSFHESVPPRGTSCTPLNKTTPLLSYRSVDLPQIPLPRQVAQDYQSVGLSLKAHPMSFLRNRLNELRVTPAIELRDERNWPHGKWITVAGVVLIRQRPGTASGIVFMTLEDETGIANLIVRPNVYQQYRAAARHGVIILVRGRVERQGQVVHVMSHRIEDLQAPKQTRTFSAKSRDFR